MSSLGDTAITWRCSPSRFVFSATPNAFLSEGEARAVVVQAFPKRRGKRHDTEFRDPVRKSDARLRLGAPCGKADGRRFALTVDECQRQRRMERNGGPTGKRTSCGLGSGSSRRSENWRTRSTGFCFQLKFRRARRSGRGPNGLGWEFFIALGRLEARGLLDVAGQ